MYFPSVLGRQAAAAQRDELPRPRTAGREEGREPGEGEALRAELGDCRGLKSRKIMYIIHFELARLAAGTTVDKLHVAIDDFRRF